MLQILIAVLAGVITIGAPCILPMLPILLGASVGQKSKTRPLFIVLGFVIFFALAALGLALLTQSLGLSAHVIRQVAIVLLGMFGLIMLYPKLFKKAVSKLGGMIGKAQSVSRKAGEGNWGGFVLGALLGLIWTPCAGPVLGSILTLIATSTNLGFAALMLVAYAIGAGIPMLLIAYGGQFISMKVRSITKYAEVIQQVFGVIILLLAISMYFGWDLVLQAKLIDLYPGGELKL
jgi:cytochrome c-type biogenesis protein